MLGGRGQGHGMRIPVFQLSAFSRSPFGGNPASVCVLSAWLPDQTLLGVARNNGGSATAFLRDDDEGLSVRFFITLGELPLVGHASLAAAYVALTKLRQDASALTISRTGGKLDVRREPDGAIGIALPSVPPKPEAPRERLAAALGEEVLESWTSGSHYFALLRDSETVARMTPDMAQLMALDLDSVVATAAGGDGCDFVSRAFAPKEGLPEDPVCGSAHLTLAPYWSDRLGRTALRALQLSSRGGELFCRRDGDTVHLSGHCAPYLEGTISI